jgi:hypothetical protein
MIIAAVPVAHDLFRLQMPQVPPARHNAGAAAGAAFHVDGLFFYVWVGQAEMQPLSCGASLLIKKGLAYGLEL